MTTYRVPKHLQTKKSNLLRNQETDRAIGNNKPDIIIRSIYSPTDAVVSWTKNNIKICIKTAPTCFGDTVIPSSGSALIRDY